MGVGGRKTEKNKETQEYPVAGNNQSHFLCNRFQEKQQHERKKSSRGISSGPTRRILPNSNWGTVGLIGVRLAHKGAREGERLWGRCRREVARLDARGTDRFQRPNRGSGRDRPRYAHVSTWRGAFQQRGIFI